MMTLQPTMLLPMLLAPGSLHLFTVVVLLHVLAGGLCTAVEPRAGHAAAGAAAVRTHADV